MNHGITNLAASVNQRLLNLRDSREDERFPIPAEPPAALTDVFGRLPEKELLWRQFLTRIGKGSLDLDLSDVIESLRRFVFLPGKAAAEGAEFDLVWPPGGPWRPREKDHAG